ncbi:DUF4192 family protein [Pseudarthrobacter sp. O4]|uniref:DUF4192 family protein n=1 Tax=Pseudarthrobacter sp. O4 TaxID=3418417 RepID=UPI003CEBEBCC
MVVTQTHGGPQWSGVEWAQQLLLHAYTHNSTRHSAPILTAVAYINWREGRGSKARQFLELALEADPTNRLARLSDLMIGCGMVSGWNMDDEGALRLTCLESTWTPVAGKMRPTTAGRYGATRKPRHAITADQNSCCVCSTDGRVTNVYLSNAGTSCRSAYIPHERLTGDISELAVSLWSWAKNNQQVMLHPAPAGMKC